MPLQWPAEILLVSDEKWYLCVNLCSQFIPYTHVPFPVQPQAP